MMNYEYMTRTHIYIYMLFFNSFLFLLNHPRNAMPGRPWSATMVKSKPKRMRRFACQLLDDLLGFGLAT